MRRRFKFNRCFKVDRNYSVTFKWPARVERTNVMSAIKRIYVVTLNNEDKCDIDRFPLCFSLCFSRMSDIFITRIYVFMRLWYYSSFFHIFLLLCVLYFKKSSVKNFTSIIIIIISYRTRDWRRTRLSHESENYVKNNFRPSSNYFKINY